MAYTLNFNIVLPSGQTGLTLEAQIVDNVGANVGSAITAGFTEIGVGNYLWSSANAIPNDHRGGVKFQISGGGVLKAFAAINPEEAELDKILTKDNITELAQGIPSATPTLIAAIMLLYMQLRNKADADSNTGFKNIRNNADAIIAKKAISDAANVFTEGKMQSGP